LVLGSCADSAAAACGEGWARNSAADSRSCCTSATNSPAGSAIESRTDVARASVIASLAAAVVA
jgi:hypothetical protein